MMLFYIVKRGWRKNEKSLSCPFFTVAVPRFANIIIGKTKRFKQGARNDQSH